MRNLAAHSFLTLLFVLSITTTACHQDDSSTSPADELQQQVSTGDWVITSFVDSGKDETNHFTGYTFSFEDNGLLKAIKGSTTIQGSWSITDNHGNDDNPGSDVDFNIRFTSPSDFEDLTEDWQVINRSADRIELVHVSGGNGGTDYLTFERA